MCFLVFGAIFRVVSKVNQKETVIFGCPSPMFCHTPLHFAHTTHAALPVALWESFANALGQRVPSYSSHDVRRKSLGPVPIGQVFKATLRFSFGPQKCLLSLCLALMFGSRIIELVVMRL